MAVRCPLAFLRKSEHSQWVVMQENVQMPQKTRCLLPDEQKGEAVNIVKPSGKPVSQVAKETTLTGSALRQWIKPSQIDQQPRIEGELTRAEQQELTMLRRELKGMINGGATVGDKPQSFCQPVLAEGSGAGVAAD